VHWHATVIHLGLCGRLAGGLFGGAGGGAFVQRRRFGFRWERLGEEGGLVLDVLHGQYGVAVIGMALEDGFKFEDGGGKLAEMDVGLGDAFGGLNDLLFNAELEVGLLEDFQGLIIVRLRLSDDLKHLNRLSQLGLFAWI
jgi:hypothetical protein